MGCKQSKKNQFRIDMILERIVDCIEREDYKYLDFHLEDLAELKETPICDIINQSFIELNSMKFNFLEYSIWIGRSLSFDYLIQKFNASFEIMESNFLSKHIYPLIIICERGYVDALKSYLPHYLKYSKSNNVDEGFENQEESKYFQKISNNFYFNAAQIACENQFIGILNFLHEFFQGKDTPPELDLHHIDDKTGENCALVASRTGNLSLIKILNETIKADFCVKNKKGQGALHIISEEICKGTPKYFLHCFIYLIEIAKVDFEYKFEEILKNLPESEVLSFYKRKLVIAGLLKDDETLHSDFEPKSMNMVGIADFILNDDISLIVSSNNENQTLSTLFEDIAIGSLNNT